MPTPEQLANRRLWVSDLVSGRFPKGTHCLTRLDPETFEPIGYCCLGVGSKRFASVSTREQDTLAYGPEGFEDSALLPPEVQAALGLPASPVVLWGGKQVPLTGLNDTARFTLPEIGVVVAAQPDEWTGTAQKGVPFWNTSYDTIPRPEAPE